MGAGMNEKKQQESTTKYQQAIKELRESGLQVEDRTEDGSMFGFIGGVRRPSSIPAQDEDDGDSSRKTVN
jgi:hypothetical protein